MARERNLAAGSLPGHFSPGSSPGPTRSSTEQPDSLSFLPLLSGKAFQDRRAGRHQARLHERTLLRGHVSAQVDETDEPVQMSFLVHLPAAAQTRRGGPLQRGSHKRWGGSTAWVPHSPDPPASPQEQPLWRPNILASPKAEKKRIFVPNCHLPGSGLR